MAEAGTGFFSPWSQDTFLDTKGMEDSSGICYGVAAIWIPQRYLEIRGGGGAGWQAFKDFMYTESGKKAATNLQDKHESAIEKTISKDSKDVVAAKLLPAIEFLANSNLVRTGACVSNEGAVISEFVTSEAGYYFIAAHGPKGGHAFAVHHRSVPSPAITLFDPNEGQVTWNSELYYKKEFLSFFSMVRGIIYRKELDSAAVVIRIGRKG